MQILLFSFVFSHQTLDALVLFYIYCQKLIHLSDSFSLLFMKIYDPLSQYICLNLHPLQFFLGVQNLSLFQLLSNHALHAILMHHLMQFCYTFLFRAQAFGNVYLAPPKTKIITFILEHFRVKCGVYSNFYA